MAAPNDGAVSQADDIASDKNADPYEDFNRGRFKSHVGLHHYVIDPAERVYTGVVPDPLRAGIHNFLFNLETPSILANDIFQGDIHRAGDTLARFVVNTTLGLGGIFDVAKAAGMQSRDNDFGRTLAKYGATDRPYLLIPVVGPSNPRDLTGKVVDLFLDPLHYVTLPGGILTSIGHAGAKQLDSRSEDVGELDKLANTESDPYATERALSREERGAEISGLPLVGSKRAADTGDNCATVARQRAQDAVFQGFDVLVQKRVFDATFADCDAWRRRH